MTAWNVEVPPSLESLEAHRLCKVWRELDWMRCRITAIDASLDAAKDMVFIVREPDGTLRHEHTVLSRCYQPWIEQREAMWEEFRMRFWSWRWHPHTVLDWRETTHTCRNRTPAERAQWLERADDRTWSTVDRLQLFLDFSATERTEMEDALELATAINGVADRFGRPLDEVCALAALMGGAVRRLCYVAEALPWIYGLAGRRNLTPEHVWSVLLSDVQRHPHL